MARFRNNRRRKRKSAFEVNDSDLLKLTESRIAWLAGRWGCSADEIRQQRDQLGMLYCPARDSLMTDWVAF